jgi:hypothetical protein
MSSQPQQHFTVGKPSASSLAPGRAAVSTPRICEAFYEGAEVGAPSLDPEGYASVDRAIRSAVDSINDSIEPYLKYMIREVPKEIAELSERDFYPGRFSPACQLFTMVIGGADGLRRNEREPSAQTACDS